jgi:transcriptional repressor NrdR
MRGVRTACYRRPIAAQQLEAFAGDVEAALLALDSAEVASATVGDIVMQHLRDLDEVAYIRFASVYRSFSDLGMLRAAVDQLLVRDDAPATPTRSDQ